MSSGLCVQSQTNSSFISGKKKLKHAQFIQPLTAKCLNITVRVQHEGPAVCACGRVCTDHDTYPTQDTYWLMWLTAGYDACFGCWERACFFFRQQTHHIGLNRLKSKKNNYFYWYGKMLVFVYLCWNVNNIELLSRIGSIIYAALVLKNARQNYDPFLSAK